MQHDYNNKIEATYPLNKSSAILMNKVLSHATIWIYHENMLNKCIQSWNIISCTVPFMGNVQNTQIHSERNEIIGLTGCRVGYKGKWGVTTNWQKFCWSDEYCSEGYTDLTVH